MEQPTTPAAEAASAPEQVDTAAAEVGLASQADRDAHAAMIGESRQRLSPMNGEPVSPPPAPTAAAIPVPEEIAVLATHMGVSPSDVSPATVVQYIEKLNSDHQTERSKWEAQFKELSDKYQAELHPLRSKLQAAWNHIRGRASNGSAPDQDFARTHAL